MCSYWLIVRTPLTVRLAGHNHLSISDLLCHNTSYDITNHLHLFWKPTTLYCVTMCSVCMSLYYIYMQIDSATATEIKGTHTTPVHHYVDDLSMGFENDTKICTVKVCPCNLVAKVQNSVGKGEQPTRQHYKLRPCTVYIIAHGFGLEYPSKLYPKYKHSAVRALQHLRVHSRAR